MRYLRAFLVLLSAACADAYAYRREQECISRTGDLIECSEERIRTAEQRRAMLRTPIVEIETAIIHAIRNQAVLDIGCDPGSYYVRRASEDDLGHDGVYHVEGCDQYLVYACDGFEPQIRCRLQSGGE